MHSDSSDMQDRDGYKSGEDGSKDENAVNHEIATLLLNLASRTHTNETYKKQSSKPDPDVAMDLSNYAKSNPGPTRLASPSPSFQTPVPTSSNPYSLFPTSTGMNSIPSSYLLQNLLIGKMQQQLSSSTDLVSPSVSESVKLGMSAMSGKPPFKPGTSPHANIPLLSGQIVAQLNALLFSIHGLADKGIESKVEVQLAAIYTRLQEIVTLVQITKTKDEKLILGPAEIKEEPKVSHQDDYTQSSVITVGKSGKISSSISPVEPKLEICSSPQLRVLPYTSKEYEPTSVISRKPVRDGAYTETSPPEKRMKMSPDNCSSSSPPGSGRKTSKGGKGIRNRVFCGDCPGCLKNDDCGQCRYCKDKTKFGGQNRLRQKCLHRRCQMDTHRRSSQQNTAGGGGETAIYSGVELARLTSHNEAEERQVPFSSLLGSSPVSGSVSSPEPEGSQSSHQTRIDKWKAKHEAMLRMAAESKHRGEQSSPSPPLEQSKLVITLSEKEDEEIKDSSRFPGRSLNTALVV
jgi:hypothetical protein